MTENQITTIVREYAGEVHNFDYFFENENKRFLTWLTRRYCLVEKSKVEETWKEITDVYLAHRHITYDGARYLFDEVLFPEIAKEVEE